MSSWPCMPSGVMAAANRLVVRNGYQPAREILTGAGRLAVEQPRVRDNSREPESRVQFSSRVLPLYLRRSKSIDELIPWLCLNGLSTGDFREALHSLPGEDAPALSPNVVVRLTSQWSQEYDEWSRQLRSGPTHFPRETPAQEFVAVDGLGS